MRGTLPLRSGRSWARRQQHYIGNRTTGGKRAGLATASKISPHSLRHSSATELLAAGVPLQDVHDAIGHAAPRTTRAYDRSRHSLDCQPTYTIAVQLHRTRPEDKTHSPTA